MFITSCSDLEFVYKENKNLINPLYENTYFSTSGYNITLLIHIYQWFLVIQKKTPSNCQ